MVTYRPAIDGLRALAVLSVCIFHLNKSWLQGGFVGVDVFFVISGYLITSIILKECDQERFSLLKFYQRRIARIFPAFFTVALVTLVGSWLIYTPQDFASAGANFTAATLSVSNFKSMFQGNYFEASPDAFPYLHCWSLSIEEQFYLFFPLLLIFLPKYKIKHTSAIVALLAAISFAFCLVMTQQRPVWAFYLLPSRAWELLAGCLLATITVKSRSGVSGQSSEQTRAAVAAKNLLYLRALLLKLAPPLGLLAVLSSILFIKEGPHFPGFVALLPVIGTVAILLPQGETPSWSERILSIKPLAAIGKISYSLYLWHWPVFSLVDYKMIFSSEIARLAIKISITLFATALTYKFIENPARSFLNQPKRRKLSYALFALAILSLAPVGVLIRKKFYVNATIEDIAKGGLVYPGDQGKSRILLMGDSNGSMYGKTIREICSEFGHELTVISAAAGDPLAYPHGRYNKMWNYSLSLIEREKPDTIIIACWWNYVLDDDRTL